MLIIEKVKCSLFAVLVAGCLMLPELGKSQIIERYIHNESFTFSSACETLDGYIYFNKASNYLWDIHAYEHWLIKTDTLLSDVDSLDLISALGIDSSTYTECYRIKLIDNHLHLLLAEYVSDNNIYSGFRYETRHVVFDSNLNILYQQKYKGQNGIGLHLSDLLIIDNSKYLAGWLSNSSGFFPCMIKQSLQDSSYYLKSYADSLPFKSFLPNLYYTDSVLVISLGSNFGSTTDRMVVMDTSLNIVKLVDMYDPTGEPVYIPNTGFLIQRKYSTPVYLSSAVGDYPFGQNQPYMLMGAGVMDNQLNFTRIDTFMFSGHNSVSPKGTINPKPTLQACNHTTVDSVLLVMPGQEMIYGYGYSDRFANDVHFYNYNASSENLNWHKVYNNGYTHSSFTPVATLPNNRFVVILNEYNWDKYPYDNLSIHLMIINGNGDLIALKENPFSRERITAFPNPFHARIQLRGLPRSISGFEYRLVDSSGKEVSSGHVGHSGMINLNRRHPGAHILRVLQDGELLQSIRVMGLNP